MKKIIIAFALAFASLLSLQTLAQARDLPDFTELVEKHGATVVNISTTQVYTRLDFQHLAKAYDAAHPRAKSK